MELEKQGISYDIYVHTYKLNVLNSPRAGEHNIPYDNNQINLFQYGSKKILVDDQDEVDKILRFQEILCKKNPWPEDASKTTMKNLIRQYYSLKRVYDMVVSSRGIDSNSGDFYDAYLFLRPDMIYMTPLPVLKLPLEKYCFYSSPFDTYGGVNDRFCLTSRYGAEVYTSRLNAVYEESNIHSETFLKKHLLDHHMSLLPLRIQAFRVRANGKIQY